MSSTVTPDVRIEADLPLSPRELSPSLWCRPESLSLRANGAALEQWDDDSGNGRHLVQADVGLQPTVKHHVRNGRSAVRFDGTRRLDGNGFPLSAVLGAEGVGTVYALFWLDAAAPPVNAIVSAGDNVDSVQLYATGLLSAAAVCTAKVATALSTVSRFEGALAASASVAVTLSVTRWFEAAAFAKATVAAALTTAIPLAAAVAVAATASASMAAPAAEEIAPIDNLVAQSYSGAPSTVGKPITRDTWHIGVWHRDEQSLFVAADDQDTAGMLGTTAGPVTPQALASTVFRVGSDAAGGSLLRGYVAEILACPAQHDETTRRRVTSYFVRKYDLTGDATTAPATEWVDISEDVVSGVKASGGMRGGSPKDRVAEPGEMSLDLDNGASNSAGVDSYYTPGHARTRPGFRLGTELRLRLSHPLFGSRVKYRGTIDSAPAAPGVRDPRTRVKCVDWMEEAARAQPAGLEVMVDTQFDKVFEKLVGAVSRQPPAVSVIAGSDVYPLALDNIQDESGNILSEFHKLAASEYGYIYYEAETLTGESRRRRGGESAVRLALTEDTMVGLTLAHERDDLINRALVVVHPRRVDAAATTVLFNLGSKPPILRGTSFRISAPYRDPSQTAQRVGGKDMVTPVAGTDYAFNTKEDGTGVDITEQLAISVTFYGNVADVQVENKGPQDGFLTKLRLRGRGLYDFEPIVSDLKDAASIKAHGQTPFTFDMPYQSSPSVASDTGQFVIALNKDPSTRVTQVAFMANWSEELLAALFDLRISDRISIDSPRMSIAARPFFINGWELDISQAGAVLVRWDLAPVDTTQFWLLEVDGRTELDETTVLGYGLFAAGWILDTSVLGTDTVNG